MIKTITNVSITTKVREFCLGYILEKTYDRAYPFNTLYEWYPPLVHFKSNLDIKNICLGQIPSGDLIPHIDDDRNSALVIPLMNEPFQITVADHVFNIRENFIINTTLEHSAKAPSGFSFIAIDLQISYEDLNNHLAKIPIIQIDTNEHLQARVG